MAAKPILFNTDMVRAILDGRKTVTRRVVRPQPSGQMYPMSEGSSYPGCFGMTGSDRVIRPPYYPGGILYAPEAWKCRFAMLDPDGLGYEVVFRDGKIVRFRFEDRKRAKKWAKYARKDDNHWQSPYFMPKEAARIFLRVTGVQVERLRDISEAQAQAEGFYKGWTLTEHSSMSSTATQAFMWSWAFLFKPADRALYGWAANPWVWVIEFERISREEATDAE